MAFQDKVEYQLENENISVIDLTYEKEWRFLPNFHIIIYFILNTLESLH